MSDSAAPIDNSLSDSKKHFREAPPEIQELVKRILQDEREVIHMQRRSSIYEKLIERIKERVK